MIEYVKFISAALLNVLLVIGVYFLEKKTRFGKFKRLYKELIIGALFGASAIYASCLFIDWLRLLLFKACKMKDFSICLEKFFQKIFSRISNLF